MVFRGAIVAAATPDQLRGRVMAANHVIGAGGGQLGNLEAGTLGSLTSPTISALTGGLITIAGAVVIGLALPAFTRHRRKRPEAQPPARQTRPRATRPGRSCTPNARTSHEPWRHRAARDPRSGRFIARSRRKPRPSSPNVTVRESIVRFST